MIDLGSEFIVLDIETDDELTLKLVEHLPEKKTYLESFNRYIFELEDPTKYVTEDSPLGKVLVGRSAGDEIEVTTPGGVKNYKVKAES